MIENGTLLQNRYLIEKQIGAGGMGAVYLAVDRRFDNYVAIKETFHKDQELGAAFEREARLLNSLNHSSLPHVSDYFTENNNYFLVMQYIEGDDLFEKLKCDGAFPVEKVSNWIDRLLDALEYLHSQEPPIIHRDIKPQNLKITPRGNVILLDFGLAKLKSEDASSVHSVFGYSRKYSPLEQIQGTGTDARSDIFSLAATAYHLLTGEPPVDVLARASEIVAGRADPLRPVTDINDQVPSGFAAIIKTALALNADERFVSVNAMRQALKQSRDTEEIAVSMPQFGAKPSKTGSFPALEAFATGTLNNSTVSSDNRDDTASENLITNVEPVINSQKSIQHTANSDYRTRIVKPEKPSRFPLAAAATLLLLSAVLATGYFALRSQPVSEQNKNSVEQQNSQANSDISETSIAETNNSAALPTANADTVVEITDKKPVINEPAAKPKNLPKTASNRPETVQTTRKNPTKINQTAENDGKIRKRIIENEPVVEEVAPPTREERIRRRQEILLQQDELSEEDFQELRRIRRQERRQRRNQNQLPPN